MDDNSNNSLDKINNFYTMKGYALQTEAVLTSSMEDYLEMIARLCLDGKCIRIKDLSRMLHVRASSASKMIQQLHYLGFVQSEKYGDISLTKKGKQVGDYLLYRHEVIHNFLCALNNSKNELEQTEKIEHFLNPKTVENLEKLTESIIKDSF
ncbi:MAG: metal-dependent transcriptional regulator [Anaerovoracaceae bacterium]|jgi:DtxR family Mn-dependent transcriptional regulator